MAKVAKENEEFLRNKAKGAFDEVIELVNDAIDYVIFAVKRKEAKEDYINRPMFFFIHHILMPFSYGLCADLLIGNLPACFMVLRFMLESLAKCYIADLHPDKNLFFEVKLLSLEKVLKKKEISTSKLLKDFGEIIGLKGEPLKLWSKLSQDWVHTRGIVKKIVDQIVGKSDLPPYGLSIPMNYTENDLDSLNELSKIISEFGKLLKPIMEKYQKNSSKN